MVFLVKSLNFHTIQPVGDIPENCPFSCEKSIETVKSGQLTPKIAQIEA